MRNFKRFGRFVAAALLLCIMASMVLPGASAVSLPSSALTSAIDAANTTVVNQEQNVSGEGRPVSVVHRSASSGSTVIGCVENGAIVTVLGSSKGYYRIDCYDMKGYIAQSQVSQNEDGEYYVNCVPESSETKRLPTVDAAAAESINSQIRSVSMKYIGVPYVSGGTSPRGFDCSGFTQYVFKKVGYSLHRTAAQQLQDGVIISKEDLQCGDLIFFENTGGRGFASHIGIYIGNGQLIHAGSKGIAVVSLEQAYFTYHYMCARRVVLSDAVAETVTPDVGVTQNINSSYWRENSQTGSESGNFFCAGGCTVHDSKV